MVPGAGFSELQRATVLYRHIRTLSFDAWLLPYRPNRRLRVVKTANALLGGITHPGDGIRSNALRPGATATGPQWLIGGLKTPVKKCKTLAALRCLKDQRSIL